MSINLIHLHRLMLLRIRTCLLNLNWLLLHLLLLWFWLLLLPSFSDLMLKVFIRALFFLHLHLLVFYQKCLTFLRILWKHSLRTLVLLFGQRLLHNLHHLSQFHLLHHLQPLVRHMLEPASFLLFHQLLFIFLLLPLFRILIFRSILIVLLIYLSLLKFALLIISLLLFFLLQLSLYLFFNSSFPLKMLRYLIKRHQLNLVSLFHLKLI